MMIGVLSLGILTGMFSFARLLFYCFNKYQSSTFAFMIGVWIGSLNKLWTWKVIETVIEKDTGNMLQINNVKLPDNESYRIISELNVSPSEYSTYADPQLLGVLLSILMGLALVGIMSKLDKKD